MPISETKKQIVIDNYFKNTCDVNTSIKEAFSKGFEVGLTKAVFPNAEYEARLKADLKAILVELQLEIEELDSRAGYDGNGMPTFSTDYIRKKKVNELIQQKINALGCMENNV